MENDGKNLMVFDDNYYKKLEGNGESDYEVYLNTKTLFLAQKQHNKLCNRDELMFQIVHQVEELWMKLIGHTVPDIVNNMAVGNTLKVAYFFKRVHLAQRLMSSQMDFLDIMSPHDYQEIRLNLGNGSGIESPGFKNMKKVPKLFWEAFLTHYLEGNLENIDLIYNKNYTHDDRYVVAECLIEFDQLFQLFMQRHFMLVARSIGIDANSLKGRTNDYLVKGTQFKCFPELWAIRGKMTNEWSAVNGVKRESISHGD